MLFAAAEGKEFIIPDGVEKIASYAFCSAASSVIHIPDSVTKIEKMAFNMYYMTENIHIKDVTVSENNPELVRDGQCIYKKSDKSLAVAILHENGELRISEQIERLIPDISVVNGGMSLEKLVYPSCLKHVTAPAFDALRARNVYFTGSVPPEVSIPKSFEEDALPVDCQVYVPETSADAYKVWYDEYKCYVYVDGWHTYHPEMGF